MSRTMMYRAVAATALPLLLASLAASRPAAVARVAGTMTLSYTEQHALPLGDPSEPVLLQNLTPDGRCQADLDAGAPLTFTDFGQKLAEGAPEVGGHGDSQASGVPWHGTCGYGCAPATTVTLSSPGGTAMDVVQSQPYDLVLRGGRVIDPAQGLDGLLDVAVRDGRIAAIAKTLPGPVLHGKAAFSEMPEQMVATFR